MVYNDDNDDLMDDSNVDNTEKNTLTHNIIAYFWDMLNPALHVKSAVRFLIIISIMAVVGIGVCLFFRLNMHDVDATILKVAHVEKAQLFDGYKQDVTVRYTLDKTFDINKKVVERTLNIVTTYTPLKKSGLVTLLVFKPHPDIATQYDYPMFAMIVIVLLYLTGVYMYAHMR